MAVATWKVAKLGRSFRDKAIVLAATYHNVHLALCRTEVADELAADHLAVAVDPCCAKKLILSSCRPFTGGWC